MASASIILNRVLNDEWSDPEFRPPIVIGVLVGAGTTDDDPSTSSGQHYRWVNKNTDCFGLVCLTCRGTYIG